MKITVNLDKNSYDIIIERGALAHIGDYLDLQRKVLVVTDSGVPQQYAATVAAASESAFVVTVAQGEGSKSIATWQMLLETMVEAGFTRSDAVVAVGGGVVGDLAGFAAASFMRGIDFYNIPTTLLSQVDSSVGGKTAVNLAGIKNIVGAFYQPKKVVIDSDVLATLDPRQRAGGMAEAIKMALCFDSSLFEQIENSEPYEDIDSIIAASIAIKAKVVEQDEKEAGLRRVLNFGHTLGHGIEAQGGLYHGECVALGMLPLCSQSVRNRLLPVLKKYGLPCENTADREKVLSAVAHDKKRAGDTLRIVTVEQVGSYEIKEIAFEDFSNYI
ncbi:MAG: 3-dehydroquinate synthase [Clostridia bacterium]|nr:3-dehydroquinate synthase [Clostridia bacterium]